MVRQVGYTKGKKRKDQPWCLQQRRYIINIINLITGEFNLNIEAFINFIVIFVIFHTFIILVIICTIKLRFCE